MSGTYQVVLTAAGLEIVLFEFTTGEQETNVQRMVASAFYGRTRIEVAIDEMETGRGRKTRVALQPCQRLADLRRQLEKAVGPLAHFRQQASSAPKLAAKEGRRFKPGETVCLLGAELRRLRTPPFRPELIVSWQLE